MYSFPDDDECKTKGTCEHYCKNTAGSYECSCREGYALHENKNNCVGRTAFVIKLN